MNAVVFFLQSFQDDLCDSTVFLGNCQEGCMFSHWCLAVHQYHTDNC